MPISCTIDPDRGLVLTTASGVLTGAEIRTFKKNLFEDARFRPGMRELADLRQVTRLDVTSADVEEMIAIDQAYADRAATHELAVLAGSDVAFGMARMYQIRGDREDQVAVFRREADAHAWLERPR